MKQEHKNSFLNSRKIPILILFLDVVLIFLYQFMFNTPEHVCFPCLWQGPDLLTPLIIVAVLTFLVILFKFYEDILIAAFLIALLVLVVSYYPIYECPSACSFKGPFGCVSYKLSAGSSELYFIFGQSTGTEIKITGMQCITGKTWTSSVPAFIEPLNEPILLASGKAVNISSTSNKVYCKNMDGLIPSDTSAGNRACLVVYINYTDITTNQSHIISAQLEPVYTT